MSNDLPKFYNYISGLFKPAENGTYLDDVNPATGQVFAKFPDSDEKDVQAAVFAAQQAFPAWSKMKSEMRAKYMNRIADEIEARLEQLAIAESTDNGKPVKLARKVDIPRAAANFRFFADAATQFSSEAHPESNGVINYTTRKPLGVVGCISPWNLPLYLLTWKIAPALAAGNTVVAKPSEVTPYTAFLLSEICDAVDLPPGVLNIVHGLGPKAGEAIVQHKNVKAISFTGGTKTGAHLASVAAPKFKKLSLELGGKNPNIIFADCDYDEMINTTVHSSFANQGQICLCGSRIFVEQSIFDQFVKDLKYKAENLTIGNPLDESTRMGALVSKAHFEKVKSYIELAKEEGASILSGGNTVELPEPNEYGFFLQPTILTDLDSDCRINQEEIFGPVVSVIPFSDEEEVLRMANDVEYGLSATLWTQNLNRAHRMADRLDCGIVWINTWLHRDLRTPFGGSKSSGVGREGGWEAMRFFTEPKNICIKYQ